MHHDAGIHDPKAYSTSRRTSRDPGRPQQGRPKVKNTWKK